MRLAALCVSHSVGLLPTRWLKDTDMLKLPLKIKPFNRRNGTPWSSCLPFVDNERALLLHRPKCVTVFKCGNYPSHLAVENWCGNTHTGTDKFTFLETCNGVKLLCARCEENAISQGLPSADELSGHHVHKGKVIAYQTCCNEENT